MGALSDVAQNIANTDAIVPSAGIEKVLYIGNRNNITPTEDGSNEVLITAIANASGEQFYSVTNVKRESNPGSDAVIADNLPNLFTNYLNFQPYERDSDAIKNLAEMDDVVAVVELKGPKTEGCFIILGYDNGLHLSAHSHRVNDNNGIPTYELSSREGEQERYPHRVFWDTDYATTAAAVAALTTPGA